MAGDIWWQPRATAGMVKPILGADRLGNLVGFFGCDHHDVLGANFEVHLH